ncbi:MAG TPA: DUF1028 domain-containing protein [Chitinophagaceae bacterium]|nr:DUF1028 domain-containing protein [Chitinophagaceae bacterium]
MKTKLLFALIGFVLHNHIKAQVYRSRDPLSHTFSIVARDSVTGEMGVAVQSHWFSVGTAVSWAEAGVGAVATQSFVNKSFGLRGLSLLKTGLTAQQAVDSLLKDDEGREVRQLAIVDNKGNVAVHTGTGCIQFASHIRGNQFAVQANMMLGSQVPTAMATAFGKSAGKPLAERMLLALDAAQGAGGDIRGQQSAALIIVPPKSNDRPWDERTVDLRVDDNKDPIKEINRLYKVHVAYEHMNKGDLAVEKSDMITAMNEYNAAMKMFPANLEMQYWTAVTLANNKELAKAIPIFRKVFAADKNWRELTRRLPQVKLLTVSGLDLKKILAL